MKNIKQLRCNDISGFKTQQIILFLKNINMFDTVTHILKKLSSTIKKGEHSKVLLKGSTHSFLIRLSGFGVVFGVQVFLARVLGSTQYGIYTLAFTWINVLSIIAIIGMDTATLRYLPAYLVNNDWNTLRGFLRRSTQITTIVSLTIGIAGIILFILNTPLNWSWEFKKTFIIAFCALPVIALVKLKLATLRALKMVFKALLPQNILRPLILGLLLIIVSQFFSKSLNAPQVMGLNLITMTTILLLGIFWVRHGLPARIKKAKPQTNTREWLLVALPLLFISGMQILLKRTDIIMLGAIIGSEEAGIYAVAVRIASFIGFGLNSINFLAAPMVAQLYTAKQLDELQRLLSLSAIGIAIFTIPTALFIIASGKWLLSLFGLSFISAYSTMTVLIAGQIVNASAGFVGLLLSMTGHQNQSAMIIGFSLLMNIVLNLILIPYYGMFGAAIATGSTMMLWNILMFIYVRKHIKVDPTIISSIRRGLAFISKQ